MCIPLENIESYDRDNYVIQSLIGKNFRVFRCLFLFRERFKNKDRGMTVGRICKLKMTETWLWIRLELTTSNDELLSTSEVKKGEAMSDGVT